MRVVVFKKKHAFTLAELLISFTILALMSVFTVVSLVSSMEKSKSEAIVGSQNFYNQVSEIYLSIVSPISTSPFDITSGSSQELLNSLLEYLDFSVSDLNCEDVDFDSFKADNCAKLNTGIKMGVKVNNDCDSELDVYEYLQKEDRDVQLANIKTRNVKNACGYIIYRTKGSKGVFKEDAFIIPLAKRKVK